jgi:hypothetical protein
MISPIDVEKSKPKIFRSRLEIITPDLCFAVTFLKLSICDMIKKKEKGGIVIYNGKHTIRTCFNSYDYSNKSPILMFSKT